MAAYAALMSLSEATELLLHKIIIHKSTDGDGVDRSSPRNLLLQQLEIEIESLRENTDFLRSVLEKSPAHPFEAQMKDAVEQAQAIIERFVLDKLPPGLSVGDDDVIFESLSHRLQRIHEDLISPAVEKISNKIAYDETDEESVGIFDSFSSRKIDHLIFGMKEERERLQHIVFDESSTELRVVSIVGMGGIGKTTLAEWFYYNPVTWEEFEVKCWVSVSEDSSARDILVSLMDSIQSDFGQPKQRDESIENYLQSNLKGRRFSIVLDDLWSPEAQRLLMRAFPDDGNGSTILITTKQEEVATNTKHIIRMNLLDEDDSYDLFVDNVFRNEDCPPELTDLSKRLTSICGGLPLAIVLVAGILLASNKSFHEWNYVFKKLSSDDCEFGHEMVDAILSLSYKHLPHRLRTCLLYLGAFPKDHMIKVSTLVKQLSAFGLQHKSTSHEIEHCVEKLINQNLVLATLKTDFKRIKKIRVHDMVRDFCLKKALQEKFLRCVTEDDSDRDLAAGSKIKVSFNLDSLKRFCNSDDADYDTHTIMCFGRGFTRNRPLISIGRFKFLKSLDLANVEIESFPNEVLNLFLLRLLALGHVPELPPSISSLQCLETLIINDAKDFSLRSFTLLPRILSVPSEIWAMSQLRHVISFCCGTLPSPNKEDYSPLQNLETLSAVMNLDCSEDLIEMIPNIKKLGIFYFGVEPATHLIENIKRLSRLEKLALWVLVPFSAPQDLIIDFPRTLRRLTLRGIRLSHRDMLIIGVLPHLQVLKLKYNYFEGDEWIVTATHGFQMLETLHLFGALRHWLRDCCNDIVFPMLKMLLIYDCEKLNEFEGVVENIPSLEVFVVSRCSKSLVEYARRVKLSNENIEVVIAK